MSQDNPPADHAPIEDEVHTVDVGDNLKSRATWLRLVFMVVFIVLANVAAIVATVVVILGFLWVLFTGETNAQLRDAGRSLAAYFQEIIRYLTYNTDQKPYPLGGEWPGNRE